MTIYTMIHLNMWFGIIYILTMLTCDFVITEHTSFADLCASAADLKNSQLFDHLCHLRSKNRLQHENLLRDNTEATDHVETFQQSNDHVANNQEHGHLNNLLSLIRRFSIKYIDNKKVATTSFTDRLSSKRFKRQTSEPGWTSGVILDSDGLANSSAHMGFHGSSGSSHTDRTTAQGRGHGQISQSTFDHRGSGHHIHQQRRVNIGNSVGHGNTHSHDSSSFHGFANSHSLGHGSTLPSDFGSHNTFNARSQQHTNSPNSFVSNRNHPFNQRRRANFHSRGHSSHNNGQEHFSANRHNRFDPLTGTITHSSAHDQGPNIHTHGPNSLQSNRNHHVGQLRGSRPQSRVHDQGSHDRRQDDWLSNIIDLVNRVGGSLVRSNVHDHGPNSHRQDNLGPNINEHNHIPTTLSVRSRETVHRSDNHREGQSWSNRSDRVDPLRESMTHGSNTHVQDRIRSNGSDHVDLPRGSRDRSRVFGHRTHNHRQDGFQANRNGNTDLPNNSFDRSRVSDHGTHNHRQDTRDSRHRSNIQGSRREGLQSNRNGHTDLPNNSVDRSRGSDHRTNNHRQDSGDSRHRSNVQENRSNHNHQGNVGNSDHISPPTAPQSPSERGEIGHKHDSHVDIEHLRDHEQGHMHVHVEHLVSADAPTRDIGRRGTGTSGNTVNNVSRNTSGSPRTSLRNSELGHQNSSRTGSRSSRTNARSSSTDQRSRSQSTESRSPSADLRRTESSSDVNPVPRRRKGPMIEKWLGSLRRGLLQNLGMRSARH